MGTRLQYDDALLSSNLRVKPGLTDRAKLYSYPAGQAMEADWRIGRYLLREM